MEVVFANNGSKKAIDIDVITLTPLLACFLTNFRDLFLETVFDS